MGQAPLLAKVAVKEDQTEWAFSANGLCVVAVAGKGLGVVAARCFRAGERITAELPLAVVAANESTPLSVFDRTVRALEPAAREAYWRLTQVARFGTVKTARGVWLSNAYPFPRAREDGAQMAAVYALLCRVNHSCRPNAHVASHEALGAQTLHAVRAIAAGEEVSVSYLDVGLPRPERRATIARKFGFECRCALCALRGAAAADSDRRQRRLAELHRTLEAVGNDYANLEALVEERAQMLAQEGQPPEWAYNEMIRAFTHCCMRDDYDAARRWMRRAIRAATTILGGDSRTVMDLRAIIER